MKEKELIAFQRLPVIEKKDDFELPRPLLFDNCLMGDCNINCQYCRPEGGSLDRTSYIKISELIRLVSEDVAKLERPPILKMSGYGEIFLLPDIVSLTLRLSNHYKHIQIATNFTMANRDLLCKFSKIPSLSFCVSLDGHTLEMNSCRSSNERTTKKICENIAIALEYGIGLELYSTLTTRNTRSFISFIEFIHNNYPGVRCYPFPVRDCQDMSDTGEKPALALRSLIDNYDDLASSLPPVEYLKRLVKFVKDGHRSWPCFVALANIGVNPDGQLLACCCGLKTPLASILSSQDYCYKVRKKHPLIKKTAKKLQSGCINCFTHYEMINLLIENPDTIEGLHIPWLEWDGCADVINDLHRFCKTTFPNNNFNSKGIE